MKGTYTFASGEVINLDHIVSIGKGYERAIGEWVKVKRPTWYGMKTENEYKITGYKEYFDVVFTSNHGYPATYFIEARESLVKAFEDWKIK